MQARLSRRLFLGKLLAAHQGAISNRRLISANDNDVTFKSLLRAGDGRIVVARIVVWICAGHETLPRF
jgi:hypothetical protein